MKQLIKLGLALAALVLSSCYPPRPENTQNICNIFQQYPSWYWAAKQTQEKWGVPISVQMAIMYEESGFQANAIPPAEHKLDSKIPWGPRQSSAVGYCQALQNTWSCYQKSTGEMTSPDEFAAASDFIGWYASMAKQDAHIEPTDAYHLYLAYHEGLGGYHAHSYWHQPWLIDVAHNVEVRSVVYAQQLKTCEANIPPPSVIAPGKS